MVSEEADVKRDILLAGSRNTSGYPHSRTVAERRQVHRFLSDLRGRFRLFDLPFRIRRISGPSRGPRRIQLLLTASSLLALINQDRSR